VRSTLACPSPWGGALAPLRGPWWRRAPSRFALRAPRADEGPADEDAAWVLAARHGDADAFDELVRRHAPRLHAVARRLVGSADAPDAVQECLMTAYQALPRFRGDARFATYLHAILVRQCRRTARRLARSQPWPDVEIASGAPGPADHAERLEARRQVARAVAQLPPRFREALVLRESAGLEYADIARALGVPVGTVRSRIARARLRLRALFERDGVAP
jgi:RNA polymerase sigma-70 factor (ECF subfamily)